MNLNQINLVVRDVARSIAFYRRLRPNELLVPDGHQHGVGRLDRRQVVRALRRVRMHRVQAYTRLGQPLTTTSVR